MLVTFLRLLFIGCALVFIFMLVHAWWHKRRRGELESTPFWPVAAIGFVAHVASLPAAFLIISVFMIGVAASGRFLKV